MIDLTNPNPNPNPYDHYNELESKFGGNWRNPDILDFYFLVNPYFPPKSMMQEFTLNFNELVSQYPSSLKVQNNLAGEYFDIDPNNIIVGNGSAEIIKAIGQISSGKYGVIFPTFNEYPESIGYDNVISFIPNGESFSYDIDDLFEFSVNSEISVLVIINPDNPSGHLIPNTDLLKLASKLGVLNVKLVVDESFIDFSNDGATESLVSQEVLNELDNLIVIKSIGKSYGVPGLRLGIVVSSNLEDLKTIRESLPIWNVNSFGEFFLQIINKYKFEYQEACNTIKAERDRFYKELSKLSLLRVIPSQSNYFLCELYQFDSKEFVVRMLDEHKVFIKSVSNKIGIHNGNYIRISVKSLKENNILIRAISDFFKDKL